MDSIWIKSVEMTEPAYASLYFEDFAAQSEWNGSYLYCLGVIPVYFLKTLEK